MDKVKLALTVLSILIIIVPLAGAAYVYRDNLLGLVLPPQLKSLVNGGSTGSASQPQFQPPQPVGQPQYNPQTGALTLSFNFTNPLPNQVSIDNLSAEVQSQGGADLGNLSLSSPIQIAAGETSTINVPGVLSQSAISQFEAENPGATSINLSLANLNVNVAGVNVQKDQVNVGQLQLPG